MEEGAADSSHQCLWRLLEYTGTPKGTRCVQTHMPSAAVHWVVSMHKVHMDVRLLPEMISRHIHGSVQVSCGLLGTCPAAASPLPSCCAVLCSAVLTSTT